MMRMKKNSMIIDVSCDKNGAIETTIPTSIENPIYYEEGIMHYAVDHTPSIFYKTFSYNNSKIIVPFIEQLMDGCIDEVLRNSLIINNGVIVDGEINSYQNRV